LLQTEPLAGITNGKIIKGGPDQYFDPAAFSAPARVNSNAGQHIDRTWPRESGFPSPGHGHKENLRLSFKPKHSIF
jgi:hypothetical protein